MVPAGLPDITFQMGSGLYGVRDEMESLMMNAIEK